MRKLFGTKKREPPAAPQTATAEKNATPIGQLTTEEKSIASQASGSGQEAKLKRLDENKAVEEEPGRGSTRTRPATRPHAFVVMPFGTKKGGDGTIYNFNAIYEKLIKATLESAGFESFRADEEASSGDILTDMFQELLLADLVLADMSIDNANVFYEIGIRHAFRKRGIVHIQAGRAYMPFDVFNVRTIPYHIDANGEPDPDFLEKDQAAILRVVKATWASEPERVHSPIYNLLTNLPEPDRKTLRTPLATGFWREYNDWKQRVTIAQRQNRIGDILLLTEEISNPLIKEDAIGEAGKALQNMGRNELALEQYRKGLEINPRNVEFRRQEAIFLNRLGRMEEAVVRLENLLMDVPSDAEAIGTLGRIYKDMWTDSWKWIKDKGKRIRTAFDSYHWLIKAFRTYLKGFESDLDNTYPGVNALTLGILLIGLADQFENKKEADPDILQVRELLPELRSTLLFALEVKSQSESADYWTLVSLAELHVMTAGQTEIVTRAYRKALTAARRNMFFLQSSLGQLEILRSLGFRQEFVEAGITAIQEEIRRLQKEKAGDEGKLKKKVIKKKEGNVFLFTGYMISNSRKQENQFPPEKEEAVRDAIRNALKKHKAGPNDLALTTGMDAGSEMLFVECCLERNIPVQTYFPTFEAEYLQKFVHPGGEGWTERFYRNRNHPLCEEFYQPDHVGPVREGDDVNERNNRWALYSALARGIDKVRLIALWDGKSETPRDLDARLVRHMVELMRETGGMVEQIHPAKLAHGVSTGDTRAGSAKKKK